MAFDSTQGSHVALKNIVGEDTRQIVAWVGAGLSASAGLPTWSELKSHLLDALRHKATTLDPSGARHVTDLCGKISREMNYWKAFAMLRDGLGQTSYRDTIKERLQENVKVSVPKTYKNLWRLGIDGILSLNLDRFAARAYAEESPAGGGMLAEFKGAEAGKITHVLNSRKKFVANLHGHADDVGSWVFTDAELRNLKNNPGYQTFLSVILTTKTVLFVGISADDIAVGSFLEKLKRDGVESGSHFWLTDRRDWAADRWAEANNVRPIRYSTDSGNHDEIDEFFDDLLEFIPQDDVVVEPVVAANPGESVCSTENNEYGIPTPDELKIFEPVDIRYCLNSTAKRILAPATEAAYREYDRFCQLYDEMIYRAWYVPNKPDGISMLTYRLDEEVERGAFGRIFRARDDAGQLVAVKLLKEDVRRTPELLRSFRRGVRSMKILEKYSLPGMVRYLDASEIPAFVSMEWVEGPSLLKAVEGKHLSTWNDILKVAGGVAEVIYAAHRLPERVLHRDIRPSNIMLRNFYHDPRNWETVVLDFDLSWHRGAQEESVVYSSVVGYLAPEQMTRSASESTRHAAVDSFGLGMTFYFLVAGKNPFPEQHKQKTWEQDVEQFCKNVESSEWKSVGSRFARLIIGMTQHRQAQRWDFGQITGELERLQLAVSKPSSITNPELVAEELAARCGCLTGYRWNAENSRAFKELPTGVVVGLLPLSVNEQVRLTVEWASNVADAKKGKSKWLVSRVDSMISCLARNGWSRGSCNTEQKSFRVEMQRSSTGIAADFDRVAAELERALQMLKLD